MRSGSKLRSEFFWEYPMCISPRTLRGFRICGPTIAAYESRRVISILQVDRTKAAQDSSSPQKVDTENQNLDPNRTCTTENTVQWNISAVFEDLRWRNSVCSCNSSCQLYFLGFEVQEILYKKLYLKIYLVLF